MARAPTLLDAHGNPVRRQALTQRQAQPGIAGVRQIWASTVASGLTPQRLAGLLRSADRGQVRDYAILAQEMEERDPHYASVLGVRKRAVSGVPPRVEPASEDAADERIAEAVRDHIAGHDQFDRLVEDCLDAIGKGFSVVEIVWPQRRAADLWVPAAFEWVDQRWLTFHREDGSLRLLDEAEPLDGIPFDPFKAIVHTPQLKSGHVARGGVARLVSFSWICKAYTLKDWMAFAETYGLPLRVGRYGPGATSEDVEKLFTAVANIGTDAAAVLPESMKIDFEQVSGSQSETVFENLARYLDEQVSKAVLGQTMTSDNGSSLAQAQVHNEVRHDIAAADARAVSATLNRDLVRPFVDLNFGPQARYPTLVIEVPEAENTDMVLRHTAALAAGGVRLRAAEVRAKLGYTDPHDDDEVIGGAAAQPPAAPATASNARAGVALNAADPFDELEEIVAEMLDDWRPVMDETLRPVLRAIRQAESLEEVQRLLDELEELPSARLVDTLVKGAFKARATGDVSDG